MRAEKAGQFIIQKLEQELPQKYTYHNAAHTRDVHQAAQRLAEGEGISAADIELLLTAAWYHDAGYLTCVDKHEDESIRLAKQYLPGFDYTEQEIDQICNAITATRLPQTPLDKLGEILADADLDYLGRSDFFSISDKLFEELRLAGTVTDSITWDKMQVKFLQEHQYFTKTAINTRQLQKELNLAEIIARLNFHEK
ncbi:HD domain-containing protein [Mucilaginibacter terrae]|uniref:HD domain-containing protein n=1 Tax=Mucilaginibacter terrae TaxID=1955052 RepID=A0ABU3GQA6_9SPHI|nr:HD domain-containing protein [Mucilaginibacter terrae]MDT3401968.1 uncharacterized protein [Mucilaginibacter terrae]